MTDNEYLTLANKIYNAIDATLFAGTLPKCTIGIVEENAKFIGRSCAGTVEEIAQRLEEIEKTGIAKTPLNCVIDLNKSQFSNSDNTLVNAIIAADTLLHEVIHLVLWNDKQQLQHDELFQKTARTYGLEVELYKNGRYKDTYITMDALTKILTAAGIIQNNEGLRQLYSSN